MILRNDDVCTVTTVKHLQKFTELTDKYGYKVIHGITPRGVCWAKDDWLGSKTNKEIYAMGAGMTIESNPELIEFLRSRRGKDDFGIHGWFHTHKPSLDEILRARIVLTNLGIEPTYFVPPFNEGNYKSSSIKISDRRNAFNFELSWESPKKEIGFMHSWRFDLEMWDNGKAHGTWWTWDDLETQLQELDEYPVMHSSPNNQAKWDFLAPRIHGKWLDIGCNVGTLLDRVPNGIGVDASHKVVQLTNRPDIMYAKAENLPFPDKSFDTAVLCGVLEQITDWRKALDEARRVASRVIGTVPYPGTTFGVVGKTRWVKSVIPEREILSLAGWPIVHKINDEHYFFEV